MREILNVPISIIPEKLPSKVLFCHDQSLDWVRNETLCPDVRYLADFLQTLPIPNGLLRWVL